MKGDAVDDADDLRYGVRGLVDSLHGLHHLGDHFPASYGNARGTQRKLVRLACTFGVLFDGRFQLLHGGCYLLQCTGLLLRASRQIAVALGNLHAGAGHAFRAQADVAHHFGQTQLHLLELRHHAVAVTALELDGLGQVTLSHAFRQIGSFKRFGPQLIERAAHDQANDEKQRKLQDALTDPYPVSNSLNVSQVFRDIHGHADHTQYRAFIHAVTGKTFRSAVLLDGNGWNHRSHRSLAVGQGGHLELGLAAGEHRLVHAVNRPLQRQTFAKFVIGALAANNTEFLEVVRNAQALDEKFPTLGVADGVLAANLNFHEGIQAIVGAVCHGHGARLGRPQRPMLKLSHQPLLCSKQNDQQQSLNQKLQPVLQSHST